MVLMTTSAWDSRFAAWSMATMLMEPTPIWLSANGSSASFLSGWRATTVTCPMWGISVQAAKAEVAVLPLPTHHRLAVLSRIHPHATCPIRVLEGELNSLHIRVVEPDRRDGGVLIVRARPVEDGGVGHLQLFRPRVAWHAIWLDGLLQRHGQAQSRPAGIKRLQKSSSSVSPTSCLPYDQLSSPRAR